ncbi:hypothetical protein Malapachy_1162 [Malassezia pachydermatis]|uniref:Uncharacterized protein n=1 Tax=Malassezia pachydermatis TaxID=77020 RepID=A0A0M9VPR8_9BASI|nr:hypothetical protein Malapachy_1162 [Malassezia pachydermatis]KOS14733.1 hypothetical protein Malapachy_1162 [Malassezia pachydermatis]
MPLHLAHHKSYQRVREDEERARREEASEDRRLAARDRSERIAQLRRQRDAAKGVDAPSTEPLPTTSINFWAEMEREAKPAQTSNTFKQAVDLDPWYARSKSPARTDEKYKYVCLLLTQTPR